jgi:hypothetical protein
MLNTEINELIMSAMKAKDVVGTQVYKLIKAEFLKAEKEKDFKGWNEAAEIKILMKMAAQRNDSIDQYNKAGRTGLAEVEKNELNYINRFIPKQPTDEEVKAYTQEIINDMKSKNMEISMKNMKYVLGEVQKKFSMANGKLVSQVLKNNI